MIIPKIKTLVISQYHDELNTGTHSRLQDAVKDGWEVLHSWQGDEVVRPNSPCGMWYPNKHAEHFLLGRVIDERTNTRNS